MKRGGRKGGGFSSTSTRTRISPDELSINLMYRYASSLGSGVSGFAAKSFQTNCAFDVDPSVGSTETYGFDEYAALYTYYRVTGYSYHLTIINQTTVPILAYALNTNVDPSTLGTNYSLYSTNPHCSSKLISNVSPNSHTFRGRMSVKRLVGASEVLVDDTYRALTTANPTDKVWLGIAVEAIGGTGVVYSTFDLKLIMHVRFYSREVDLSLSAHLNRVQAYVDLRQAFLEQKRLSLLKKQKSQKQLPSLSGCSQKDDSFPSCQKSQKQLSGFSGNPQKDDSFPSFQ